MNKKIIWFKAKNYGWGWYPCSWQGWLIIAVFIAYITYSGIVIDSMQHSVSDFLINFVPNSFVAAVILILICWKTGEKPEWRWGPPKK